MITAGDIVNHNKTILNNNRSKFQSIFGIPLTRFMHPLFGFDVIQFDQWLGTPDGTPTNDYLLQRYGQEALDLVKNLL